LLYIIFEEALSFLEDFHPVLDLCRRSIYLNWADF
jgi:hypothetical protein